MAKTEAPPVLPAPSPELTERRYVYNGHDRTENHGYAPRGNRPVKHRKQSPFNVIGAVVVVSLLIVFYVWIKISVNQLVIEVSDLQSQHEAIKTANDIVLADINKKSTLGRIEKIAKEQLSMISAKEQPRTFEVNQEQLDRLAGE